MFCFACVEDCVPVSGGKIFISGRKVGLEKEIDWKGKIWGPKKPSMVGDTGTSFLLHKGIGNSHPLTWLWYSVW